VPGKGKFIGFGAAAVLLVAALWQLSGAAMIAGKAWLAPVLIERAWQRGVQSSTPVKPWPWADTYPMARLDVPRGSITRFVLAGEDMSALAFGPVSIGGDRPIIFGHRDTHFLFLGTLRPGDRLTYQEQGGPTRTYRVKAAWQAHKDALYAPDDSGRGMLLVTCFPLGMALKETDERYIVYATLDSEPE